MIDLSPQATEPDLALVYLASFFESLDCTPPPQGDDAKLDALAWLILDKRPKTLLGLAIRARAEKHLCRYLWTAEFERLPPADQAARVVIEGAMLLARRLSNPKKRNYRAAPIVHSGIRSPAFAPAARAPRAAMLPRRRGAI
jgi:hypothetical protein